MPVTQQCHTQWGTLVSGGVFVYLSSADVESNISHMCVWGGGGGDRGGTHNA